MNKIYLFAIASILAIASLMAGTFTSAAIAQAPTTPNSEMGSTTDPMSSKHDHNRWKCYWTQITQLHLCRLITSIVATNIFQFSIFFCFGFSEHLLNSII